MKNLLFFSALISLISLSSCRKVSNNPPRQTAQRLTFVDEFIDNRNNWQFADGTNLAYGVISNGTFKIDYNDNYLEAYYVSKAIAINTYNDFSISSRIGSNKNMGLLFGYNDNTGSYGYNFSIDYDGNFALYDEGGNGYGPNISTIVPSSTRTFINARGNWNDVRIDQVGNRWYGYINDNQVFDVPAQNLKGGSVGFVVLSNTQGEADYIQADWYE